MYQSLTCSVDLCLKSPVGCDIWDVDDPIEVSTVALEDEEVLDDGGVGRDFLQKGKRHVLILPMLDT